MYSVEKCSFGWTTLAFSKSLVIGPCNATTKVVRMLRRKWNRPHPKNLQIGGVEIDGSRIFFSFLGKIELIICINSSFHVVTVYIIFNYIGLNFHFSTFFTRFQELVISFQYGQTHPCVIHLGTILKLVKIYSTLSFFSFETLKILLLLLLLLQ